MKTLTALVALLLLSAGCVRADLAIPDHRVPHKITRRAVLYISVRTANGEVEEKAQVPAGWYLASPMVADGSIDP